VINQLFSRQMKGSASFKLKQIIKQCEAPVSNFNDVRKSLFDMWGEEVEENGEILQRIKTEHHDEYMKEFNELLEQEIELSANKLTIDDIADVQISAMELTTLEWMFEEG
jgi:uncharacterized protein involved in tolerance to divalent cations